MDCHLLLNLYKREIESSGNLIHNACQKTIYSLMFFQLCILLKFVGSEKYLIALFVGIIFGLTIIVAILYSNRFLRPQLFKDEEFRMDSSFIQRWTDMYSPHIQTSEEETEFDKIDADIEKEIGRIKHGSFWIKRSLI